jgi:hypothetical protein
MEPDFPSSPSTGVPAIVRCVRVRYLLHTLGSLRAGDSLGGAWLEGDQQRGWYVHAFGDGDVEVIAWMGDGAAALLFDHECSFPEAALPVESQARAMMAELTPAIASPGLALHLSRSGPWPSAGASIRGDEARLEGRAEALET